MIIKERQVVSPYHLLRKIKSINEANRKRFPTEYFQDDWRINNSLIAAYERFFSPVLRNGGIVDFVRGRASPVVLDLMASSDSLANLFDVVGVRSGFGLAVSLLDKRDVDKKERDKKLGIKQLAGNLQRASTWVHIQRELEGRKADLIMERAVGGLGFLSADMNLCAALMKRAWKMLNEKRGMLLVQTHVVFDSEEEDFLQEPIERIVKNWLEFLAAQKIESDYAPCVFTEEVNFGVGLLKLIKSPDSPRDLPLPPFETLDVYPLASQEDQERMRAEREETDAILQWLEKNK